MEARDKEIERLNRVLDGGRPTEAVLRDSKKDSSERVVAHLNVQVNVSCCFSRTCSPAVVFFVCYVGIHASGISVPLSLLMLLGWSQSSKLTVVHSSKMSKIYHWTKKKISNYLSQENHFKKVVSSTESCMYSFLNPMCVPVTQGLN